MKVLTPILTLIALLALSACRAEKRAAQSAQPQPAATATTSAVADLSETAIDVKIPLTRPDFVQALEIAGKTIPPGETDETLPVTAPIPVVVRLTQVPEGLKIRAVLTKGKEKLFEQSVDPDAASKVAQISVAPSQKPEGDCTLDVWVGGDHAFSGEVAFQ
jgi:hypothetical protein